MLTIAMLLAPQDVRQVHDDPKPRTGPVQRRVAGGPSGVHAPRRPRSAVAAPARPVRTARPVNGPPEDERPITGKSSVPEPANTGPRGRPSRPRAQPPVMAPPAVVPMPVPPAPPAPPPRRPSPLPAGAQAPAPRGSPGSWVSSDDYPMPMLRAHASGTVVFDLDVDTVGRVYDCRVTGSSGWSVLDSTTCSLMRRRARFEPARNATGTASTATWSNRFRWELPDVPVVFGSWARVVRYVVDAQGVVKSCSAVKYGLPPAQTADPCRTDAWRMKALHGPGTGLVTITYAEIHRVEGMPIPEGFVAPAGTPLFSRTIDFTVQPLGAIGTCSVKAEQGSNVLTSAYSAYDCHTGLRYLVPPQLQGAGTARRVSFTVQATSNGAAPVAGIPMVEIRPTPPPRPPAPPPPPRPSAQPAALSPSAIKEPLTLRGSPASWITNDDYPAAALRAGAAGTVAFRIDVDATGMPIACTVTTSSGHALLDATTCDLMMRRARFNPAMGHYGRPVPASWASRMRWELPDDGLGEDAGRPGTWTWSLGFTIASDGSIASCSELLGQVRMEGPGAACAALRQMPAELVRSWRGSATGPVTLLAVQTHTEVGTRGEVSPPVSSRLKPVLSQRASFEIGDSGLPVACSGTIDALVLPLPPIGCGARQRYPAASTHKSVIVTQVVLTNGDEGIANALKRPEDY